MKRKKPAAKKRTARALSSASSGEAMHSRSAGVASGSRRLIEGEIRRTVDRALSGASDREINRLVSGGSIVIQQTKARKAKTGDLAAIIEFDRQEAKAPADEKVERLGRPARRDTARTRARIEEGIGAALERGERTAEEILARDDLISATNLAGRLQVSRQAVHVKRRKNELLGLKGAKNAYFFPAWQVKGLGLLDGLSEVLEIFGDDSWGAYFFLRMHHPETDGRTAVEALQKGRKAVVLAAAENMGRSFS